jgi:hypothetical protein
MGITAEAEISDHDILDYLEDNPHLITKALTELAKPGSNRGKPRETARFAAALLAIGGTGTAVIDNARAGAAEWAAAFQSFDSIDKDRAIEELMRFSPHEVMDRLAVPA